MKTKYRLRRSADFRAVTVERRGTGDELLRIKARPNSLGHPRIGVAIPKRLGGAVVRNRLRRRLLASAAGTVPALGAFDLVLLPKPAAVTSPTAALAESLSQGLAQLKVVQ